MPVAPNQTCSVTFEVHTIDQAMESADEDDPCERLVWKSKLYQALSCSDLVLAFELPILLPPQSQKEAGCLWLVDSYQQF